MKLFKRKQSDVQPEVIENGLEPVESDEINTHVSNVPLDEDTQKLIAGNEVADNPETDDIPSANASGRDTGNNKKFKWAIGGVVSLLVILIGLGASLGHYQEKSAEQKALAAEQAAQKQKQMATGSGVDIAKDQEQIANSNFQNLPPPASAVAPDPYMANDTVEPVTTIPSTSTYIEPVEPIAAPTPQPRYANSDNLVAGRDYSPPVPMPAVDNTPTANTSAPSVGMVEPINAPATTIVEEAPPSPPPKGSDSNVLVDVNAVKVSAVSPSNERQKEGKLAGNFTPTVLADGEAGRRSDTSMLLLKGTSIPCVLKTKIDSTYQGFTVCQITKDVYSANGKTLLIERGSTVFGEQNTQVQQGQARVSILWTKIETPEGISINIDSPAAGKLGEMGVGAKVNNHFIKRFGSSIMLSFIQDGLAAASKRMEGRNDTTGSNNTTVSNTSSTVENMAEKALNNTINMPPTAIVKPGTLVNILVARDVDFSSVYKLKRKA